MNFTQVLLKVKVSGLFISGLYGACGIFDSASLAGDFTALSLDCQLNNFAAVSGIKILLTITLTWRYLLESH
jgi:hypothetical protein